MKEPSREDKKGALLDKIASKIKTKVNNDAAMMSAEAQSALEDRMLSVLELLTNKCQCALGCITSSVRNTRCIQCYRDVG